MSDSDNKDYKQQWRLESLDDLPTDDSISLGSSSSSDDDDDDDSNVEQQDSRKQQPAVAYDEASSSNSNDEDCDSSDDSSSSSSEDDESDAVKEGKNANEHDDSSSSSNDDSSSDEQKDDHHVQHLTLQERLHLKQHAGISNRSRSRQQERKTRALKVASERLHKHQQQEDNTNTTQQQQQQQEKKKRSKHKPTEASSKRSAYFQRGAPTLDSSGVGVEITAHRYKPRDPRIFGSTSKSTGALDSNYAFLQELREEEISKLKKQIAVRKLSGKKGQRARRKLGLLSTQGSLQHDQEELKRLLQGKASFERAQVESAAKLKVKRKIKTNVASGKQGVYYLKKREFKKLQLEAKYEEIRKRGGDKAVDKALAKRRKKLKSKDSGYIPKNI